MFCCRGRIEKAQKLKAVLNGHGGSFGLATNFNKSLISLSPSVPKDARVDNEGILNVEMQLAAGKYFGLPLLIGRKKKEATVSISMWLCTLQIVVQFMKDHGFRALVGLWDHFDYLCCVEKISISKKTKQKHSSFLLCKYFLLY